MLGVEEDLRTAGEIELNEGIEHWLWRKRYREELALAAIATELTRLCPPERFEGARGCDLTTVYYWLQRLGLHAPALPTPPPPPPGESGETGDEPGKGPALCVTCGAAVVA